MRLGLIVNCVGYDEKSVDVSAQIFEKVFPTLEKLDISLTFKALNSDWIKTQVTQHTNTLTLQNPENVRKLLESKNNKGIVVRQAIEVFQEDEANIILHIDGSGKFDLSETTKIIETIANSSVDAILTIRDISGLSLFRTLLEMLERNIVLSRFPDKKIEDGQSGCWCIRLHCGFTPEKELTANGYEIELDILIQLLSHNSNIVWLPIKVINTGKSKYDFTANIVKMVWLVNKLSVRKDDFWKILNDFVCQHIKDIKQAEKELIEAGDNETTFDKYVDVLKKVIGT